jgi:hypothetical protein
MARLFLAVDVPPDLEAPYQIRNFIVRAFERTEREIRRAGGVAAGGDVTDNISGAVVASFTYIPSQLVNS